MLLKPELHCAENNSCLAADMHDHPNVIGCKKFDICIDGKVVSTQTCGTVWQFKIIEYKTIQKNIILVFFSFLLRVKFHYTRN